jgi:hypothetical protein
MNFDGEWSDDDVAKKLRVKFIKKKKKDLPGSSGGSVVEPGAASRAPGEARAYTYMKNKKKKMMMKLQRKKSKQPKKLKKKRMSMTMKREMANQPKKLKKTKQPKDKKKKHKRHRAARGVPDLANKRLRLATDFSGCDAPVIAMNNLEVPFVQVLASDSAPHVEKYLKYQNRDNEDFTFYRDVVGRDHAAVPASDLYVFGPPCQPFSPSGLRKGDKDGAHVSTTRANTNDSQCFYQPLTTTSNNYASAPSLRRPQRLLRRQQRKSNVFVVFYDDEN